MYLVYFYAILMLGSCIAQISFTGPAHLVVTNINTGEVHEETSILIIYTGGSPNDMIIKRGETIEIKFIPPESYKDHKFNVNIVFLDKDVNIDNHPYSIRVTIDDNVPIGSYPIYCSAMCHDWSDESSCEQSMGVRIVN